MQGCLAVGCIGIVCYLTYEILIDFVGEVGWSWAILLIILAIAMLAAKR